ncbi:MAG: GntR family transcriptional regulator [Epibacterium sp.]|nr:GntR family transcriptional regulator [Epibacterium sp.]NQX75994.1 GntR family transcriptional regulator [Epibacterium sp.]
MPEQQITKSDSIAQKLAVRIVRGKFQPDEKLRQDLIAREFGVSQVTVREALLRLASTGLVISMPRRGMCVAPMDREAVEELRVMRCALEPVALQRSVPNLTKDQIIRIEEIHEECDGAATSEDWEDANSRFHTAVIAACQMPRLIEEIGNLQLLYSWHFNARHTARWRRRDDPDHAAILAAIKDRDAERAHAVMKRHLARLT